jgi:hypothetical protein
MYSYFRFPNGIKAKILDGFGIESFVAGYRPNSNQTVQYLWAITLPNQYFGVKTAVATIETVAHDSKSVSRKALLLIQSNDEFHPNPLRAVDATWDDEIFQALQSINIISTNRAMEVMDNGDPVPTLKVLTASGRNQSELYYYGNLEDKSIERLWSAVLKTVKLIADIYNDDTVNRFLKRVGDPYPYTWEEMSAKYVYVPLDTLDLKPETLLTLRVTGMTVIGDCLELLEHGDNAILQITGFTPEMLIELKQKLKIHGYSTDDNDSDLE